MATRKHRSHSPERPGPSEPTRDERLETSMVSGRGRRPPHEPDIPLNVARRAIIGGGNKNRTPGQTSPATPQHAARRHAPPPNAGSDSGKRTAAGPPWRDTWHDTPPTTVPGEAARASAESYTGRYAKAGMPSERRDDAFTSLRVWYTHGLAQNPNGRTRQR